MIHPQMPLYQKFILNLPFRRLRNAAASGLGMLVGGTVQSIVHSSKMRLDLREGIQRSLF
jgi:hypothetical protein